MNISIQDFRVPEGAKVKLAKWPTAVAPVYRSKDEYEELLQQQVGKLARLQELLYASDRYALLMMFQGMDTAGKDGAIKHVMSGVNPQGCEVTSFKHPSATELQHDFLWRTTRALPERGRIGIFNRSYYEEVIVVRVHPELLRAECLPDGDNDGDDDKFWRARFRSIVDMENHLSRNGTRIIKFFLHISRDEQRRRLLERIDDPAKVWKFNFADIREREHWPAYMDAYERCIGATSTRRAPWYVVPADDKQNARLIVAKVVADTLEKLGMEYPEIGAPLRRSLRSARKALEA
ncbi:MAG TPA: ADP-polyphosphate phosphotransferase [Casimicrobiaceae bacterium]|nr:ADP-polyphosphate phosphotransferase [Casimicrobiaceae bacterium]